MVQSIIDPDQAVATLVNVFTVASERQQELVDLLVEATEQVMQHRDGFISANIHASDDGQRVVNYAQWESAEALQAALADSTVQQHLGPVTQLAEADPKLYRVVAVHHR